MENGHQFLIEEQVQLIEGKRVEQVDVQVKKTVSESSNTEEKRTFSSSAGT